MGNMLIKINDQANTNNNDEIFYDTKLPNIIVKEILQYLINFAGDRNINLFLQKYTIICKEWNQKIIPSLKIEHNILVDTKDKSYGLDLLNRYQVEYNLVAFVTSKNLISNITANLDKITKLSISLMDHGIIEATVELLPSLKQLLLECNLTNANVKVGELVQLPLQKWFETKDLYIQIDMRLVDNFALNASDFMRVYPWSKNGLFSSGSLLLLNSSLIGDISHPICNIQSLELTEVKIDIKSFSVLFSNSPHFTTIQLCGIRNVNNNNDGEFQDCLVNTIMDLNLPNLEYLEIVDHEYPIQFKTLVKLYKDTKVKNLTTNYPSFIKSKSDNLSQEISNPHIEIFHFTSFYYGKSKKKMNFLKNWKSKSSLKHIVIDSKLLDSTDSKDYTLDTFTNLTKISYYSHNFNLLNSIVQLNLSKLQFIDIYNQNTTPSISTLIQPLQLNHTITSVSLTHSDFTFCQNLLSMNHTTIEHIHIVYLSLQIEDAPQTLIQAIKNNNVIRTLTIKYFNRVSQKYHYLESYIEIFNDGHQLENLYLPISHTNKQIDFKLFEKVINQNPQIQFLKVFGGAKVENILSKYFVKYRE
ncbi:hypothetical protein DLAC_03114 [Tieghemostelium lacteum]|uniref:Uncharacterized protein n=1 Tax=Tieghemostelium lacteum TaxID=361077 RepID=A0A152A2D1_TIELA|nr:hypothetical protein DLAC_03114 [Tieghemostelium lacteum]|eukprot:KYR00369.1 hypothetical protein DLAC_03114 [Tieghemostelium lacteum]